MERMSPDDRPPGERASESDDVFRGSDGFEFDRSGHEYFGSDPYAHNATRYLTVPLRAVLNLT